MQPKNKQDGGKFVFCVCGMWTESLKHVPEIGLDFTKRWDPWKLKFHEKSKQEDMKIFVKAVFLT